MKTRFKLTEQNYRYLFDNATDAILVHDTKGDIVDANGACEKLTGYTREELIGMNIMRLCTGEKCLNIYRQVRRRLLNEKDIEQPYEQQLLKKDETTRIIKMATSLVIIDGETRGFQHIARDVTEEKSAEEMLSKITGGSPIPSFVINKQHKVTHWNKAIESLSGISAQRMVGTNEQWRAFYTEKRPSMADLIVDGVSAGKIKAYYWGKCTKSTLIDGAYEAEDFFPDLGEHGKWLHFTASPIRNEGGEIIGAIETLEDVTEEKKLQENMHFYVQLITKAQEDERKRIARELHDDMSPPLLLLIQQLDKITSSARPKLSNSLKETLEDLRSQAIEALEGLRRCAQDLRPPILDHLGLVATLEWMTENMAKNEGIDAHVEVIGMEKTLSAEIQLLLFRIAQEALNNIRRHAEASEVVVKLEFGKNNIKLSISDNGEGFEMPKQIEDLASASRLGIMGMFERARLLGGSLQVKSKLGKGTQVAILMPLFSEA